MNRTRTAAAVIAVAAAAATSSAQVVLNFDLDSIGNPLPAGTIVDDEFNYLGISISATNNNANRPDAAIIFDSANPTGGDNDLATPGVGNNDRALGNILIIAERLRDRNNDGLVDNPDDERSGGSITFDLDFTATAAELRIIDIEENGGTVSFFNSDAGLAPVAMLAIPDVGDNNAADLAIDNIRFDRVKVRLAGSGGVGELTFTPVPTPASAALLGLAGLCAAKRRRG